MCGVSGDRTRNEKTEKAGRKTRKGGRGRQGFEVKFQSDSNLFTSGWREGRLQQSRAEQWGRVHSR